MMKKLNLLMSDFFEIIIKDVDFTKLGTSFKKDGTPVTKVDLIVHELFHEFCQAQGFAVPILSEESFVHEIKNFPVFVIDPIDGTKDLIRGNGEWSISIAYLNSTLINDPLNQGWIFQPSEKKLYYSNDLLESPPVNHQSLKVLVSRTEFNDGLFDCISSIENLEIVPMGSIALKLGKLSYFECDLVISFRPKSIWDIAAGLVLTSRNNGVFYCEGLENPITHFQGELTYKSPMLFGSRSCLNRVDNIIKLLKV